MVVFVAGGGGGGVTTRVVFVFFADALAEGAAAGSSVGAVVATTGGGSADVACTTGLSGCAAGSGLSFGSPEPDDNVTTKSASNKTAPAAAPAATANCFFVAPVRLPASDAVPENVGCGIATMLGDSTDEGDDCEKAAG